MSEHHAHRGLMSRLPDDATYWEALTERLVRDATGPLSAYRHRLARLAAPLAIAAAAAWLAALLWLPPVEGVPTTPYDLAPRDPLAALLAASPDAPTMAAVIAVSMPEQPR